MKTTTFGLLYISCFKYNFWKLINWRFISSSHTQSFKVLEQKCTKEEKRKVARWGTESMWSSSMIYVEVLRVLKHSFYSHKLWTGVTRSISLRAEWSATLEENLNILLCKTLTRHPFLYAAFHKSPKRTFLQIHSFLTSFDHIFHSSWIFLIHSWLHILKKWKSFFFKFLVITKSPQLLLFVYPI